ncbi:ABC transporter ATP-binding protein [Streptococcus suis]|nr:ABC transporter ATP-binding protein [Streptococcus suis]
MGSVQGYYRSFSYLQDNRVLYTELIGCDHLKLVQQAQKWPSERIEQVIEEIGISVYVKAPVKTDSLGMKQHLLLAIAIMNHPKLLLLDEPLNGLDPTSYIETRHLLKKMAEGGTTIIISSHQLKEVDQLTCQLLFLKNGRLIAYEMDKTKQCYKIEASDNGRVLDQLGVISGPSASWFSIGAGYICAQSGCGLESYSGLFGYHTYR